jgi:hypothetical protein
MHFKAQVTKSNVFVGLLKERLIGNYFLDAVQVLEKNKKNKDGE